MLMFNITIKALTEIKKDLNKSSINEDEIEYMDLKVLKNTIFMI
ncbi:hypothetical protein UT300001_37240 [Clostridium sp. CTA-1]